MARKREFTEDETVLKGRIKYRDLWKGSFEKRHNIKIQFREESK